MKEWSMKKLLTIFLVLLLLMILPGCRGGTSNTSEDTELLLQAINQLKNVESYELTREESVLREDEQMISQIMSETKVILEPYTNWNRNNVTRSDGKFLTEAYQVLENDQFDVYIRTDSLEADGILGDWENPISINKEHTGIMLDLIKKNFDAQLYLLSSNIGTFKIVEDDELKDENHIKYGGYLEQDTILEAYQKYIRDFHVKSGLLPDSPDLSLEDLKIEITSGDHLELQGGIPAMAFSQNPVPISLWINQNTLQLERVVIDATSYMQSLMEVQESSPGIEVPLISEATVIYEIRGINNLEEIPMPE
jgi:hypothetical protein